jgi:sugar fermentation stimulation protein A
MRLGNSITIGSFVKRPNRFTIVVRQHGKTIPCHFPNPGRLKELLLRGAGVAVDHCPSPHRKTEFEAVAVRANGHWVSIDSSLPNRLVKEALMNGSLREFAGFTEIKAEAFYRGSRIDFLPRSNMQRCLLEVKSCTLVRNGNAIFPDAPTIRRARHVRDLVEAKNSGYRACILFIIQKPDAYTLMPNSDTDPEFAAALRVASKAGVEIYARKRNIRGLDIRLAENVPVKI